MKTFVLAEGNKDRFKMISPGMAKVISSKNFVKCVIETHDKSLWVTEGLASIQLVFQDRDENVFKHLSELPKRMEICILAEPPSEPYAKVLQSLEGIFTRAIALARNRSLPIDQLIEVHNEKHPERFVIGGQVDEMTHTLILTRGDLSRLVVPLSTFRPSGNGTQPDFSAFAIGDFGQTLKFGEFEASVDSVLYEFDPNYRKVRKAELAKNDKSIGGALRRLRIQKGLRQTDFPDLDAREIGRIERGEVKPRKSTIEKLAQKLEVSPEDIKTY